MAFKAVQDLGTDTTIALGGFNKTARKDNPTTLTGYFLGSRQVDSPKSKTGKAYIHVFQTPTGNIGVWGKTDLDRKIQAAQPGALTRVSFDGMMKIPGKNDMYKYKVEVDTDDTIEVTAPQAVSPAIIQESEFSGAGTFGDVDGAYDGEDDVDAEPAYVAPKAPAVAARAPTAEQQAKVNALLNRARK